MNHNFKIKNTRNLAFQRNVLAALVACLLLITLLQTVLLFFKAEKVIIAPPELNASFWVQGSRFSDSYLEEMGIFFSHLLLDVSSENSLYNGSVLLRYVEPSQVGSFRTMLREDHRQLSKNRSATTFTVTSTEVEGHNKVVTLTGILHTYVAGKKVSSHEEEYQLGFLTQSGRLFLRSFKAIKRDKKTIKDGEEL